MTDKKDKKDELSKLDGNKILRPILEAAKGNNSGEILNICLRLHELGVGVPELSPDEYEPHELVLCTKQPPYFGKLPDGIEVNYKGYKRIKFIPVETDSIKVPHSEGEDVWFESLYAVIVSLDGIVKAYTDCNPYQHSCGVCISANPDVSNLIISKDEKWIPCKSDFKLV